MKALAHLFVTCLIAAASLGSAAAQVQGERAMQNLVTVTGMGEASIAPDLAILTAGVTTTAKTAREASEATARAMTSVMTAIKNAGIGERDVQTSRLSLQPVRENRNGVVRISGFQASNQVTIKIRDLAKTAGAIDALVAAGANDISGLQFTVAQPSKALDQAREAAIADARRKAEIYARAANVHLGGAVNIVEQGNTIARPYVMMRSAAPATPVSPGEETLQVTVTVSYALVQ